MASVKTTLVRQWMTADPVTPETTVPDAALIMRQRGFRRLPVGANWWASSP